MYINIYIIHTLTHIDTLTHIQTIYLHMHMCNKIFKHGEIWIRHSRGWKNVVFIIEQKLPDAFNCV